MRCRITGTDSGDLTGSELIAVEDETYGLAWIFEEADAIRLVNVVNTQAMDRVSFEGSDGGDLMGEPLSGICLDGNFIGWAQEGWER